MLRESPGGDPGDDAGSNSGPSVTEVLRAALAPLTERIAVAFIYGPMAQGAATAHSDIEVMIIGSEIAYADVIPQFIAAAKTIGRAINPSVYSTDEWTRKLASGNRVVLAVLKQRKIFLIGTEDAIPRPR